MCTVSTVSFDIIRYIHLVATLSGHFIRNTHHVAALRLFFKKLAVAFLQYIAQGLQTWRFNKVDSKCIQCAKTPATPLYLIHSYQHNRHYHAMLVSLQC